MIDIKRRLVRVQRVRTKDDYLQVHKFLWGLVTFMVWAADGTVEYIIDVLGWRFQLGLVGRHEQAYRLRTQREYECIQRLLKADDSKLLSTVRKWHCLKLRQALYLPEFKKRTAHLMSGVEYAYLWSIPRYTVNKTVDEDDD